MDTRKSKLSLVSALTLVCLLALPATVVPQCMVAGTNTGMPGTMTFEVTKTLSAMYVCSSVFAQMNAVNCSPSSGGANTTYLTAEAMTATTNPQCVWTCACGMVAIDGGDGLPVELMDFGFEYEESGD